MCRKLLCLLLHAPETPNTNCMGKFATLGRFRPFLQALISMNWTSFGIIVLAESCSTRIIFGKLLNKLEVGGT